MKLDILDGLSDEELRAVIARANELLKAHDEERKARALLDARALKAKALTDARAVLASVGLSLKDMGTKKARSGKPPAYHVGHTYQHPANKTLTWNGKGKKPAWLAAIEAEGGKAIEAADCPANDNVLAPTRKTG